MPSNLSQRAARALLATLVALVVSVAAVTPVSASTSIRHPVTGAVEGSAPFTYGGPCSFVEQHYLGTITPVSGDHAHIDVDVCITFPGGNVFPAEGTFVITAGRRHVRGTATGGVLATMSPSPFDLTLVVTSSGSSSVRAGSTLHFTGVWASNNTNGGPITGAITDHG